MVTIILFIQFLISFFYVYHAKFLNNCNYIYEVNSIVTVTNRNYNNASYWKTYQNITSALKDVSLFKNNGTCILLQEDQLLLSNHTLTFLYGFSIIGAKSNISISCLEDAGLYFYKSENISFQNLILKKCGCRAHNLLLEGGKNTNQTVLSTIFLLSIRNINIVNVTIFNSVGFAMVLINISGKVSLYRFTAQNNTRVFNSETSFYSGGGVLVYQKSSETQLKAFIHIKKCSFNLNKNERQRYGFLNEDMLYSVGAGLIVFFGESVQNNTLLISNSEFIKNEGLYGGGLLLCFLKNSKNNKVRILKSTFIKNKAKLQGGGLLTYSQTVFTNFVKISGCSFFENAATFGGALSHYSEKKVADSFTQYSKNKPAESFSIFSETKIMRIIINNCTISENYGEIGVGIYAEDVFLQLSSIFLSKSSIPWNNPLVTGQGALFSYHSKVELRDQNIFTSNNITAIILDISKTIVEGNMEISNNSGFQGGAIAIYQYSSLDICKDSTISFLNNWALSFGGAIYVKSEPQYNSEFENDLKNTCFMKISPSTLVNFNNNTSQLEGKNDISTSSFTECNKNHNEKVLSHYFNTKWLASKPKRIEIKIEEWNNVYTGKLLEPNIYLFDELNNSVTGYIKIIFNNEIVYWGLNSNIVFSVKGNISQLYNVSIQSGNATIYTNVKLIHCPFAYSRENDVCFCSQKQNAPKGLFCNSDGSISISCGFYTNTNRSVGTGKETTQKCPYGYCKSCNFEQNVRLLDTNPSNIDDQCNDNRTGYLCSKCKAMTSLLFGSENCKKCEKFVTWVIIFFILGPFFVVLCCAIFLNVCIYESWFNSTIYFYQVLQYIDSEIVDKSSFLTFLVGLLSISKIKKDLFEVCLIENWNNLDKLALEYLFPVSMFLSLFIQRSCCKKPILECSSYFHKNKPENFLKVLPLILILTYADLLRISFLLLQPVDSSVNHRKSPFLYASVFYGEESHFRYLFIAAIFLIMLAVCPLILIPQLGINRIFPPDLINAFTGEFKGNPFHQGFASFYFFSRIIIIGLGTFLTNQLDKFTAITLFLVTFLVVFTFTFPFEKNILNYFDSFVLFLLALLGTIKVGKLGFPFNSSFYHLFGEKLENATFVLSLSPAIMVVFRCSYLVYKSGFWTNKRCSRCNHIQEDIASNEIHEQLIPNEM
ncbi:uncharacterized protein LOC105844099 isoform X3 [Hydra vulgaris]|uniref:Uncharacterized protein LOC105844099 isoform X3 n=1 Tax=Hydra vulgaris TaxID=6087 RepID=A0ABM4DG21_HYDVU